MTQTLEGTPVAGGGRTLGRRVTARRRGGADCATATAAGHRGEAGTP
jgi:hypothetical protein